MYFNLPWKYVRPLHRVHVLEPQNFIYFFSGGSVGKESAWNVGDPGSVPGSERSPGQMATHSSILAQRIQGQRGLLCSSPWDHKELDTTEWLTLSFNGWEKNWGKSILIFFSIFLLFCQKTLGTKNTLAMAVTGFLKNHFKELHYFY